MSGIASFADMPLRLGILLRLVRAHQWVKNAFVAAPLFFSPYAISWEKALLVLGGVLCFCTVSSAVYIVNDYVDREADREHPIKCQRPLAAGAVSVAQAFTLMGVLGAAGLTGAFLLSPGFFGIVLAYFGISLLYSFWLKHVSILDLIIISAGFVLRVAGGAELVGVRTSVWIILCTGFLALFLGIAKRRDDLARALDENHRPSLKGYNKRFLDSALVVVLSGLLTSYTIYTTDRAVMEMMDSDKLYLTVPFVLAGVLRYLQIIEVEQRSGSPTRIALGDRFIQLTVLGWIATFAALIYL